MKKKLLLCLTLISVLFVSCRMTITHKNGSNDSNKVTITYETEHGVVPKKITLEKGYILTLNELPPLQADGYTFEGWYDGLQIAEANVYIAQKNVTLKAKWNYVKSDAVTNIKAVGSDGKITLSWDNPTQKSFTGVKIRIFNGTTDELLVDSFNVSSSLTSYEYTCNNLEYIKFEITTIEMEEPETGYVVSVVYGIAISDKTYFVSDAGSSTNDGKTLETPMDSISTAYSKIAGINDGTSEYCIILLTDVSKGGSLTNTTSYSLYYLKPTKALNLTISSIDSSKKKVSYSSGYGRVFYIGSNLNITFNNIIVTGGSNYSGDFSSFSGGGILVDGKLNMNNCTVEKNSISTYTYKASSYTKGGGIFISSSGYCKLVNTDILNNSCYSSMSDGGNSGYWYATAYGGGIYNDGTLIMNGGKISGNKVSKNGSGTASGNGVYGSGTFDENVVNEDDN